MPSTVTPGMPKPAARSTWRRRRPTSRDDGRSRRSRCPRRRRSPAGSRPSRGCSSRGPCPGWRRRRRRRRSPTPPVFSVLAVERRAADERRAGADDAVGAEHALRQVGDVHRAALAAAEPVLLAEDLVHHAVDVAALGDAVAVAAMRRGDARRGRRDACRRRRRTPPRRHRDARSRECCRRRTRRARAPRIRGSCASCDRRSSNFSLLSGNGFLAMLPVLPLDSPNFWLCRCGVAHQPVYCRVAHAGARRPRCRRRVLRCES